MSSGLASAASAGLAAGSIVVNGLELFGGIGQALELKMTKEHHECDKRFNRINYHQDKQNLRLDALDHAKEEIRSHYDTYVGRIDTLLLVLALIWPFALNTIQFSDPFVPGDEGHCPECIEEQYRSLVYAWVALLAIILILPFWGILCMIRVKLRLDEWLEYSLAGLKKERRGIVRAMSEPVAAAEAVPEKADELVQKLVLKVSNYQDELAEIWTSDCSQLVHAAHSLLWMSAYAALLLTSLSLWIFLWNRGDSHRAASFPFAIIVAGGGLVPIIYHMFHPSYSGERHTDADDGDLPFGARSRRSNRSAFPLASPSALQSDHRHDLSHEWLGLKRQRSPLSSAEAALSEEQRLWRSRRSVSEPSDDGLEQPLLQERSPEGSAGRNGMGAWWAYCSRRAPSSAAAADPCCSGHAGRRRCQIEVPPDGG